MQRTCRLAIRRALCAILAAAMLSGCPDASVGEPSRTKPRHFANGFPTEPGFFPVGVWLQHPRNAAAYARLGINTYIGLWEPPTHAQLAELERHGMHLITAQSARTLALGNAHVIKAWLQPDEPDNAQPDGRGGWGDCILPDAVVSRYEALRAADPTRPVFLNFGQAVANPSWFGRGSKCARIPPQSYYTASSAGADILSFDIYPAAEERQRHVMGRLELVGRGVANLRAWSHPSQPVWNAIETTHINNPARRPLPHEVRSEVWMSLIHGSSGIFYFVHEWQPSFREDAVFRYPDTVGEIARVNAEIRELAPVLKGETLAGRVEVKAPVDIATLVKRQGSATYVFAVSMEKRPARAVLVLPGLHDTEATVLGEDRAIPLRRGALEDDFAPYGVRLYRIPDPS
jgi:hypothetical protein